MAGVVTQCGHERLQPLPLQESVAPGAELSEERRTIILGSVAPRLSPARLVILPKILNSDVTKGFLRLSLTRTVQVPVQTVESVFFRDAWTLRPASSRLGAARISHSQPP